MTKNKEYPKKLEGQYRALEEHLKKITQEQQKPIAAQDQGLLIHWEKPLQITASKSPS